MHVIAHSHGITLIPPNGKPCFATIEELIRLAAANAGPLHWSWIRPRRPDPNR